MADEKTLNNSFEIQIDDGRRRVPVRNLDGEEVGVFYFRPTDVDIITRYNEKLPEFEKIVEPLQDAGITAEGQGETDMDVAALAEAKRRLFEIMDYIFGGNMSEAFFGTINPFSPVNGDFYCLSALEAVGNFISVQFQSETDKFNAKVGKYTNRASRRAARKA